MDWNAKGVIPLQFKLLFTEFLSLSNLCIEITAQIQKLPLFELWIISLSSEIKQVTDRSNDTRSRSYQNKTSCICVAFLISAMRESGVRYKGISLGVMHFSASEEMRANDLGASDVFTIIWKDNSEIIRSCPSK